MKKREVKSKENSKRPIEEKEEYTRADRRQWLHLPDTSNYGCPFVDAV